MDTRALIRPVGKLVSANESIVYSPFSPYFVEPAIAVGDFKAAVTRKLWLLKFRGSLKHSFPTGVYIIVHYELCRELHFLKLSKEQ